MRVARSDRIAIVSAVLAILFATGCGEKTADKTAEETTNDLKAIGLMYNNYLNAHAGKAPASADDLEQNTANTQQAIQGIKSGKYVIIWNSTRKAIRKAPGRKGHMSDTVLGYEKEVPTAGGMVLMITGSTRRMTAGEFQAAPKATGE
jgi:hypothetical protein